jgi:excisionase family DNA binding protein
MHKKEGSKWFTIKEAAKYLSIGEPTLYRWMRDGKITFRKVGDSTRFLVEDLDSFVQVFPSEKDSEKVKQICQACHSDNLVEGVFRTTGLNYFRPKKTKFWALKDSNIKTHSMMCVQCGAISLFGDKEKMNSLLLKIDEGNDE